MKNFITSKSLVIFAAVVAVAYATLFSEPTSAMAATPFLIGAALSTDRDTQMRAGVQYSLGVATNVKIYAGSFVAINSSGYAVPASDTAGLKVVGRAEEAVDNTGGANAAKTIRVMEGVFKFTGAGLTIADVGKPCFISDDQTISVAATANNVCAGIIEAVDSATEAWVEMCLSERAGAAQADSVAADVATLKTDFNALLAKLRAGRIIAS